MSLCQSREVTAKRALIAPAVFPNWTVYQQADQLTMRNALTNRDQRRAVGSR
jgi:hypothetical protein